MTKQDYYMFAADYYQRLAEGSDMSVDSTGSTPMSNLGQDTEPEILQLRGGCGCEDLEETKNNIEKSMVMDSAFAKEAMMLATVKHQNVVQFVGARQKPLVWCIVTEYAKGWGGGGGGSREMIQHDPTTTKWMSTALALYYGSSLLAYYPSRT
ncbi:unnamed protein product [Sphagnum troendelagicum]